MAQKKISGLPQDTGPTVTDYVPTYDVETTLTKRVLLSDLIVLFFSNIPSGAHSDVTRGSETMFNFIASGGVITGDSVGVNRNASMTAMVCYINGRRISISAVTARTYTASKDTYVDVLDNLDGTGTLVYTEVTNNAASPALAANSIRVGIVVTGATTIAAAASINQGSTLAVLPIASSIAYTVTDSLGNLIYPNDSSRKLLGYRQILAAVTTSSGTYAQITGLSVPVIVPGTNRRVKVTINGHSLKHTATNGVAQAAVYRGTVPSGTLVADTVATIPSATFQEPLSSTGLDYPGAGSFTYNGAVSAPTGATGSVEPGSTCVFVMVELD